MGPAVVAQGPGPSGSGSELDPQAAGAFGGVGVAGPVCVWVYVKFKAVVVERAEFGVHLYTSRRFDV